MLELPVYQNLSSDITFTTILDNIRCKFRLMWNTKSKFWMVNTYEEPDNNFFLYGLKIVPNYPFLNRYNPSFPGEMICLKKGTDVDFEITYNNFGSGWGLFYLTSEEFEEWSILNGFQ